MAKRLLHDLPASTVGIARMAGGAVLLISFVVWRGVAVDLGALSAYHLLWILVTGLVLAGYVASWFLALARAPAVDVTALLVAGALITAVLRTTLDGIPLPEPGGLVLVGLGVAMIFVTRRRRLMST